MKIEIVVPQVGEAVSEMTIVRWFKAIGQAVKAGEPLFEVDAEKSIIGIEAADDGILSEIRVPDGSVVMPLDVVGYLDVGER